MFESLVMSVLLFTGVSAAVLVSFEKQALYQQAYTLENTLVVALNGKSVHFEVRCADLTRRTELRCLTEGDVQPINGVVHRLDLDGLTIVWPRLGVLFRGYSGYFEDIDTRNRLLWVSGNGEWAVGSKY